ncbi:hypothetical protein MUO14_09170 [Halobacillus shinanisalinarum]|uniref:Uncharacterized protein n=1 Tax=Halobacillus shinanisalinarum TaxID=2932258 RepID=A0ABY4H7X4_9BACI|nr:hypothetical protein [Halobacillus shinanisalinarum]UOQ95077.1 hypothetical protein MUO14_09170 [Halobacillus shinanisalinarum]
MKRQMIVVTENMTKMYLIGLSIMTASLLFFLCSGFVFGNQHQGKVQQTPLNEQLNLSGSGDMVIEKWIYNPNRQLMTVTLNIDKSTALLGDPLTFVAQEKDHPKRELPTTVEYHDEGRYVISIQQFSSSFDVMALDISKEENSDAFLVQGETTIPEGGEERTELARIYTDQRKVKTNQTLSIQTEQEYEIAGLSQDIREVKQTINQKEKQIQNINQRLNDIDQKMVELQSERLYETAEEKEQTDAQIHQLKNQKDMLNQKGSESETTIQTMKDKLAMLKEKREMILD